MPASKNLKVLNDRLVECERCPRLRAHCTKVAQVKRAGFSNEDYFGKPIPNFGELNARKVGLLIVGLAPAAHGANRTGRMFTGDRSGDFLFRAMHETGFASQPTSVRRGDGLELTGALITAACHCAPPGNKPLPEELANCAPYLEETLDALPRLAVVLCLGRIAFESVLRLMKRRGWIARPSLYKFGHGTEHGITVPKPSGQGKITILCSYHPSQQNTFTGKLTAEMLRDVFARARTLTG